MLFWPFCTTWTRRTVASSAGFVCQVFKGCTDAAALASIALL
jgi:hypothetical protein